ncbi:NlpC/P60 family protein [Streptomyces sp. HNM0663]|uniref:NlpC/P60 family protein n=1 Tax=Streptomyces chengmaiensis TaxID=3040919 RepID=A0ABT6HMB5_9ACTN|nr:C40 family peptidase [Streptomyces chengmaiensis]MDH2389750.1 NlpC/P60 family protein [Streptomyces chengmaiensis]
MNRRRCAAAAIHVVCALATVTALNVLASPGTAFAAPEPPPAATAPQAPAPPADDATADADADADAGKPGKKTLEEVRQEIDALYRQAASATDAYNLAEERAEKQSAEIVRLAREIVKGEARIKELKDRAGAAARAQYRGGGLPPEAQLALSDDPRLFLDGVGRLQESQKATRDLLSELNRIQDDLTAYAKSASDHWTELEAHRVKQEKARKAINAKIEAAKKLEDELEKEELERLLQLERRAQYEAQAKWLDSGALKEINRSASPRGKKALEFATAQMGKPYVWGAEGPDSYDCSGLTSQAWAAAGRTIPRTSQEQWRLLPRIAIEDMRPGDLIIYHADASHVGMYVGDGAIVHAPRPGRDVTLAGAGSMKILGVVRPDK